MLSSEMNDPLLLGRSWRTVLNSLDIEPSAGDTFALRGTRILRIDGGIAVIEARSNRNCEWMTERLREPIRCAVSTVFGRELTVEFVPPQPDEPVEALWGAVEAGPPLRAGTVTPRINCAFTFDRYMFSRANQLALESCRSLLGDSQKPISPVVVVWGAPGMGKTHLLHALAADAAGRGRHVACLNAEEFTTRYQYALRARDVRPFQEGLRGVDLLLVDDLQYLEGKVATMDELVNTIEAVINASGHVVVASERHPADLGLPPRLLSRLGGGTVSQIEAFPREDCLTFVQRAASEFGVELPEFAIQRIVALEAPSVRILQGAVHAAIALARARRLEVHELDRELVRLALPATAADTGRNPRDLLAAIACHFQTTLEEMTGRSRKPALTRARAAAAHVLQRDGRSLREIGEILGNRDRTTIGDLIDRGRAILAEEPTLHRVVTEQSSRAV